MLRAIGEPSIAVKYRCRSSFTYTTVSACGIPVNDDVDKVTT